MVMYGVSWGVYGVSSVMLCERTRVALREKFRVEGVSEVRGVTWLLRVDVCLVSYVVTQ